MQEKALLLTGDRSSADDRRAERLLEFFGVPYQRQSAMDFPLPESSSMTNNSNYRLVCAARTFAQVMGDLQQAPHHSNGFTPQIHSVFLYSNGDPVALANVLGQLSGANISIRKGARTQIQWSIADDPDGVCGPMRALRVHPAATALSSCDFFDANGRSATPLIGAGAKAAFLKLTWRGVPFFVSSVPLLDIDADLTTRNFNVRDHLFSAVPAVSYIRWAFPHSSWNTAEAGACLVIDDPLLKARYGFVRYRELLALMKRLRFSTSIAFIPWNFRRSDPKVVQIFKDNPENYSLCVHGCDHTADEFAGSDRLRLRAVASEAVRRMSLHERRTNLAHDRVMVFPQGAFSEEAILELKRAGFDAVVNTEVHSDPPRERKLKISDVWDVAVMSYGDFPIYTRRYPAQGVENFAFDLLLGKPSLVVIHHDFCSNGYARLAGFIDQLNALKVALAWRRLGEVVRRSYRQKEVSSDAMEIEMYGSELLIENRADRGKSYLIRRREREPKNIESLRAGSRRVSWDSAGDYMEFRVGLSPGESTLVKLRFKGAEDVGNVPQNFAYRAKTMLRRYLSEARDNYLAPAKARMIAFSRSRQENCASQRDAATGLRHLFL
jgi:hypothetical protein